MFWKLLTRPVVVVVVVAAGTGKGALALLNDGFDVLFKSASSSVSGSSAGCEAR